MFGLVISRFRGFLMIAVSSGSLVVGGCRDAATREWEELERATVVCATDTVPVATIGRDGSGVDFTMIGAAAFLPNESLVIGDRISRQQFLVDSAGALAGTFGRHGDGPGEFQQVEQLAVRGDTLLYYDGRHRRISRFDHGGRFLDTAPIPETWPSGGWVAVIDSVLVRTSVLNPTNRMDQVVRDTMILWLHSASQSEPIALDTVPGTDRFFSMEGGFSAILVPLGRRVSVAAPGDRIVVGDGGQTFTVWRLGSLEREEFSLPDRSVAVDSDLLERIRADTRIGRAAGAREALAQQIPLTARTPSFGPLVTDQMGVVWIPVYRPTRSDPAEYYALDDQNRLVEHVRWPRPLEVVAGSETRLAAVAVDDFDIPVVHIFRRQCR